MMFPILTGVSEPNSLKDEVLSLEDKKGESSDTPFISLLEKQGILKESDKTLINEKAIENFMQILNLFFQFQSQSQTNSIEKQENSKEEFFNLVNQNSFMKQNINSIEEFAQKILPQQLTTGKSEKIDDFRNELNQIVAMMDDNISDKNDFNNLLIPSNKNLQLFPQIMIDKKNDFVKNVVIDNFKNLSNFIQDIPKLSKISDESGLVELSKNMNMVLDKIKSLPESDQINLLQKMVFYKDESNIIEKENFNNIILNNDPLSLDMKSLGNFKINEYSQKKEPNNLQSRMLEKNNDISFDNNLPIFFGGNDLDNKNLLTSENERNDRNNDENSEYLELLGKNGEIVSNLETKKTNLPSIHEGSNKNDTNIVHKLVELSDQLKAAGGGTAKLHIQDSQLGTINLQIDMKNKSTISVSIQAEHESVGKNIEDKVDVLKQSLDSQKINLADFKVTIIDKSSNAQSQFSSSGGQEQYAQNYSQNGQFQNNFMQNSNGDNKNPFLVEDVGYKNSVNNKNYRNVQKNSHTNIQRGANGSIKVLA